jgi:hypothetical protein
LNDYIDDYGAEWEGCVGLNAADALRNAESYASLAIWAVMANWGFTLQRPNENGRTDKEFKTWAEQMVQIGALRRYEDVTKRMIRAEKFTA